MLKFLLEEQGEIKMGMQDYAYPAAVDYSFLVDRQLEQALNILINSAAAASTLNDWDEMFVDIFSDADGTSNTIDTGNTTATWDTDHYETADYIVEEAHGENTTSTRSISTKAGMKITTGANALKLNSVTKYSDCAGTLAYLEDATRTPIATSNAFSGDTATFGTPQDLAANTTYYVQIDKSGAGYTESRDLAASYPIVGTLLNWVGAWDGSDFTDRTENIASINVSDLASSSKFVIQTNAITIEADPLGHQVYCHKTLAGTGAIDYDISFDNGVTEVTGQALGQKNEGVHAGSQMILKLNLTGKAATNTAEADDYGVLLYY